MKIKLNTKKIKKALENFTLILIEKSFLTIILIFAFSLILGFFIFFKYSSPKISQIKKEKIEFEQSLYEKVLRTWQERENSFQKVDIKEYPNPFR